MSKEIFENDTNGNITHGMVFDRYEFWFEYDENKKVIYYKNNTGCERHYKYKDNIKVKITEEEYEGIKIRKKEREYLERKVTSRFELMEIE